MEVNIEQAVNYLNALGVIIKSIANGDQTINLVPIKESKFKILDVQINKLTEDNLSISPTDSTEAKNIKIRPFLENYKKLYLALVTYYLNLKNEELKKEKTEKEKALSEVKSAKENAQKDVKSALEKAEKDVKNNSDFVKNIVNSLEDAIRTSTSSLSSKA